MNKQIIIGALLMLSVIAISFKQNQNDKYKTEEHFDKNCNCLVRETFYPDGRLLSHEELASDSFGYTYRNGIQVYFNDKGDTVNVTYYKNDLQDGMFYSKFDNKRIGIAGQYKNGNKTGAWRNFSEYGKIVEETIYDNTGNEADYLVKHYGANEVLIFSEQFIAYKLVDTKVFNQVLYDKILEAKENSTGKQIFIANCRACHNPLKDATGPRMAGITKRRSEKWLRAWISNSAKLIAEGDPEAVAVYNEYGKTAMTSFLFSDKEMGKLIAYLKTI